MNFPVSSSCVLHVVRWSNASADVVYTIPIRGMIEPALLYVIRRGVQEAEDVNAKAIIFVMDTPGGTLQAASDIVRTIQKIKVPTYTFVEKDAFSAGAIIAMATKHIYMAPGTVIGDAMPIMMTPWGGVQEMPEDIKEKAVSAVAALIRSAAEEGGHNKELAEKMVRREIEFKIGDEVISPAGQLLTLTNVEAERKFGKDKKPLLSEGTVKDVNELLKTVGLEGASVKELEVTAIERVARFIAALAPLFLIVGLLGLYIEFKMQGAIIPGAIGVLCLAIFFWGHHIAGLAGMEDILIFLLGMALLLIELLFIPGFGVHRVPRHRFDAMGSARRDDRKVSWRSMVSGVADRAGAAVETFRLVDRVRRRGDVPREIPAGNTTVQKYRPRNRHEQERRICRLGRT